jgi:hypothetical protein
MKRFQFKTGLIFASWALLLIFGCPKKKPPIPPEEQPPTLSTTQQPTEPEQAQQNPPPQNPAPAQEQPQAANNPPEKPPPPKHPRPHPVRKPAESEKPQEVAKNTPPEPPAPPKIMIQEGGSSAANGQNGAANADDQATTQQLLDSTEANLRGIKRQLSASEQTTVTQIRDYVKQSKQATSEGDLVRAHKLAVKAHLLSDDLAKAR